MSVIKKQIRIDATPEAVWRFLSQPDKLATWLMRNDFEPRVGHEFSFFSRPHGDWDGRIAARVVECEERKRLSFTWNANTIGNDTLVSIELSAEGSGTLVTLHHTDWEDARGDLTHHIKRHSEGWDDHLGLLAQQVSEAASGRGTREAADWSQFELFFAFDAPVDRIFRAWASSGGMESFFVETMQIRSPEGGLKGAEEIAAAGDTYAFRWYFGTRVQGKYLIVDQDRTVAFTFGDEAKVRVDLFPDEDRVLLRLRQYDMPTTDHHRMHLHANCRGGWAFHLTLLKVCLEHGIDARDKARETAGSLSTYFDPRRAGARGRAARLDL